MSERTDSALAILGSRGARVRRILEIPVMIAALAVLPVIFIERHATSAAWLEAAQIANWLIWGVFVVEFAILFTMARRKAAYARQAWLDIAIIVLSFPLLPVALASTRLFRLVRLARVLRILRLVRLAAVLARVSIGLRVLLRKRGLAYLMALTALLTVGFGCLFALVEPDVDGVVEGLWWAVVTMTTVGYGDVYPESHAGRVLAGVLMFVGIGFVATLTAAIAAHFVDEEEAEVLHRIRGMEDRMRRIEEMLGEVLVDRGGGSDGAYTRRDERRDVSRGAE